VTSGYFPDEAHPAGPDYPQGSPAHPGHNPEAHRTASRALRAAARRAVAELDSAALHLPDGDTIEVCTVAQVIEWLDGLAVRTEAGEPL
jgi:phytoene/squalene synthetase